MRDDRGQLASARINRRHFLAGSGVSLGAMALGSLLGRDRAGPPRCRRRCRPTAGSPACRTSRRRRSGSSTCSSPAARRRSTCSTTSRRSSDRRGKDLPDSIRMGQRLTGMTSGQTRFPVAPSIFKFAQHGQSGAWLSELLPHTAKIADDLCFIQSMHTEAINHDPAITFFQTGSQLAGRPSIGAVGRLRPGQREPGPAGVRRADLARDRQPDDQPLYDRLWGSGFLPTRYQGVKFRSGRRPGAVPRQPDRRSTRRPAAQMLDDLGELNGLQLRASPATRRSHTRIAQYEMAYRMQTRVPELTDLSSEPKSTSSTCTAPTSRKPGTLRRELPARPPAGRARRAVRPALPRGWDQHGNLPEQIRGQCRDTDQPSAALITDLKQRGLLDDTLVIWGGEFGRTVYCQGELTADELRPRPPPALLHDLDGRRRRSRPGMTYGETDDFWLQHRRATRSTSTTCTRRSCTCSGIDHDAADLQVPGPRLPPDRRPRATGPRASWPETPARRIERSRDVERDHECPGLSSSARRTPT